MPFLPPNQQRQSTEGTKHWWDEITEDTRMIYRYRFVSLYTRKGVCRILVRGVNAPLPPEEIFFLKFDYKMVHSEEYLNKYVVSIASFSTPACPDCSQKLLFFACFRFLFFHPFSTGVSWPHLPLCADAYVYTTRWDVSWYGNCGDLQTTLVERDVAKFWINDASNLLNKTKPTKERKCCFFLLNSLISHSSC